MHIVIVTKTKNRINTEFSDLKPSFSLKLESFMYYFLDKMLVKISHFRGVEGVQVYLSGRNFLSSKRELKWQILEELNDYVKEKQSYI